VKAIQARKGSRDAYAHVEESGGWRTEIDDKLKGFLAATDSLLSRDRDRRWPSYIQHRGGQRASSSCWTRTRSRSPTTAATGNTSRQGNLFGKSQGAYFVMDYAHRRRVKIWGEARVVRRRPALTQSLMPKATGCDPNRSSCFKIAAWDTNCPQHIPQKFDAADVAAALAQSDTRIAELEAELAALKGEPASSH